MFHIGPHAIKSRVLLAPMAGVTDLPYRKLCLSMGAGLATSEMLTSDTRLWQSTKTRSRIDSSDFAGINSMQIAGYCPSMMAEAAKACVDNGAQIVDINMGCPAKKVCKKAAGSALLKDELLVSNIISAIVNAVNVPVTLKIRTGWDTENRNGVRIAQIAEQEGISALAVHGRTRACRFVGEAEYDTIAEIIENVTIPVFANGDINSAQKAAKILNKTGAAAVMIGRPALGNPWIFPSVNHFLIHGEVATAPQKKDAEHIVLKHIQSLHDFYGDFMGVKIARKHFGWYAKTFDFPIEHVKKFNQIEYSHSQIEAVHEVFEQLDKHEEKAA